MAEDRVAQLERCLLEVYELLGSWAKTGYTSGYGSSSALDRGKFQDWITAVDAAFSDGEVHVHRDFGEDPCPPSAKHAGGYHAVWCAKANGHSMPTIEVTHHPEEATCPSCLEQLRVALCARADDAMTRSFAIGARQSALKTAETGDAPPIKKAKKR